MSTPIRRGRLPRVIPVLLIKGHGLTKTEGFKEGKYIGDAVNAVRIFNEKQVDEIMLLDIEATPQSRGPRLQFIQEIASEAFMPLGYGGGITQMSEIEALISGGVEKVCLNSVCYTNPGLVTEAARVFGSQSILASVDVRKSLLGGHKLFSASGAQSQHVKLIDHLKAMENAGVGEIVLNSIDRDGQMKGYDTDLIRTASDAVGVPLVALGGAGQLEDLKSAISAGASAAAAGSLFVYFGKHRAVLITYPSPSDLRKLFFGSGI